MVVWIIVFKSELEICPLAGKKIVDTTDTNFFFSRGAFDISLIASIASHLTYWGDEDVNHFMLSQMLSRASRQRNKQL